MKIFKSVLLIIFVMCFALVSPSVVWAQSGGQGNHYGWDQPATVGGTVDIGGYTIPFDLAIQTNDWVVSTGSDGQPVYTWTTNNISIVHGSTTLANFDTISVVADLDPAVQLIFAVNNLTANVGTFTLNSSVVGFSPLVNPSGFASAGLTLTDNNSDGGTLTGLYSGGKAYEADYNGSAVFSDNVSTFTSPVDNTITASERVPGIGNNVISGSVSNIESQFSFTLSGYDSASGTSNFKIIPEPSTIALALLGLGATALIRKRRS
jgi:hypothetical protein